VGTTKTLDRGQPNIREWDNRDIGEGRKLAITDESIGVIGGARARAALKSAPMIAGVIIWYRALAQPLNREGLPNG